MVDDMRLERLSLVAGVDEAGRGPWAGPVVAAAVMFYEAGVPVGINDSKKLSAKQRERLFQQICNIALVAIAVNSVTDIEHSNIRQSSLDAMKKAVCGLYVTPSIVLVDGIDVPDNLPCVGKAVIKGDAKHQVIGAASIVAKVIRDRIMINLSHIYPGYGFERHKGYGTRLHRMRIASLGICPLHRKNFKPIRAIAAPAS